VKPELILASASPQRRLLLKKIGLPFRIRPSRVPEASRQKNPRRLVVELARRKAESVARRFPRALVLGADTIVVCGGKIIVKPKSVADSRRILRLLSGRRQTVYTGVALAFDGGRRVLATAVATRVWARRLDDAALASLAGKHMDKAGAYAVQDSKDPLISRIEGDRDNVIGLPVRAVRRLLRLAERLVGRS